MSGPGVGGQRGGFLSDLVGQLRAGGTHGQLDRVSDEALLRPFVVSPARQREIPVDCDLDAAAESRIRSFYQAVAAGAEKASGAFTTTVVDVSHEGFGRVIVFAGRLVVLSEVVRDAQRFGFPSIERLTGHGESLITSAVKILDTYPEVAHDDS